jgi:hypothetical protein
VSNTIIVAINSTTSLLRIALLPSTWWVRGKCEFPTALHATGAA